MGMGWLLACDQHDVGSRFREKSWYVEMVPAVSGHAAFVTSLFVVALL